MVGVGSQYLACYRDADDDFLMGENTYRLTLPPNIPARNFWSATAYHPDTRSLLQNGQDKPSVSTYDEPEVNPGGSVYMWFAAEAPEGKEKNWIRTIPEEGWFILIRLYGPLEPYFDETWKPNDIEKVKWIHPFFCRAVRAGSPGRGRGRGTLSLATWDARVPERGRAEGRVPGTGALAPLNPRR
ncbi:MAG: DUF1214 domain-containing protein [Planctomycetota bacterium]|jgi:hypothetical protein